MVRLFAIGLVVFGLYRIAEAIPALKKLKEIQEKQKEMMGQDFHITDLFPSFTEMVFGPVVFVFIGASMFFLVKKIVRFIIGSEQIDALLALDAKGRQNKSAQDNPCKPPENPRTT